MLFRSSAHSRPGGGGGRSSAAVAATASGAISSIRDHAGGGRGTMLRFGGPVRGAIGPRAGPTRGGIGGAVGGRFVDERRVGKCAAGVYSEAECHTQLSCLLFPVSASSTVQRSVSITTP